MANLEPFESRIPDVWFIKLKFSIAKTSYLTTPGNQAIKSLTQVIALSLVLFLPKRC